MTANVVDHISKLEHFCIGNESESVEDCEDILWIQYPHNLVMFELVNEQNVYSTGMYSFLYLPNTTTQCTPGM